MTIDGLLFKKNLKSNSKAPNKKKKKKRKKEKGNIGQIIIFIYILVLFSIYYKT